MKRILFIHGSADLYGASRVLVSIIKGIDRKKAEPIVLLPYREMLDRELEALGVKVVIGPIAVLRRQFFNPKGICLFVRNFIKSLFLIRKIDKEYGINIIYTNTSPVLSGAIYAKIFGKLHIWHIHEITMKPSFFRYMMPRIINFFSGACLTTSNATKRYVMSGGMRDSDIKVIYNGISGLKRMSAEGAHEGNVVIGMIGRFNWWKGQKVFVKAVQNVIEKGTNANFIIAGSPFKNEETYLYTLKKFVSELGLEGKIRLLDFTEDRDALYAGMDIVVIPSTQPEPFGLVAVEAMAMGRPVIASNIGGLPEIVLNGETGILFEPGSDKELSEAIIRLVKDKRLRNEMGEAGLKRQQALFTEEHFQKEVNKIILETLAQ